VHDLLQDVTKDYRSVLSRQALLSAVSTPQMLALVPPEVRQVYDLLTTEFSPLELCQRMAPLLDKLTVSHCPQHCGTSSSSSYGGPTWQMTCRWQGRADRCGSMLGSVKHSQPELVLAGAPALQEMSFTMSSVLPIPKVTLGQYVNQLKQVTVLRLLKQLSEVFSTLKVRSCARGQA
jgi:hypothetical protein